MSGWEKTVDDVVDDLRALRYQQALSDFDRFVDILPADAKVPTPQTVEEFYTVLRERLEAKQRDRRVAQTAAWLKSAGGREKATSSSG